MASADLLQVPLIEFAHLPGLRLGPRGESRMFGRAREALHHGIHRQTCDARLGQGRDLVQRLDCLGREALAPLLVFRELVHPDGRLA